MSITKSKKLHFFILLVSILLFVVYTPRSSKKRKGFLWGTVLINSNSEFQIISKGKYKIHLENIDQVLILEKHHLSSEDFLNYFKRISYFTSLQFKTYENPYAGAVSHQVTCDNESAWKSSDTQVTFPANQKMEPAGCSKKNVVFNAHWSYFSCPGFFVFVKNYTHITQKNLPSHLKIKCAS